jgi:hypothetical protein
MLGSWWFYRAIKPALFWGSSRCFPFWTMFVKYLQPYVEQKQPSMLPTLLRPSFSDTLFMST